MVDLNRFYDRRLLPTYFLGVIYLLQCSSIGVSAISVMSVDFGSEWMKVAIVSPGVPMEIALNKESKRKTPVAVAFRDGERTFGEDALNVGVRFPRHCYLYLLELLGKGVDNPLVQLYKQTFPYYEIIPHETRRTVVFKHDGGAEYSVEELVGMILHKAKEMAELAAGQKISDAVITVPGYFNQAERRAMLQAAQLAGINVLQLINDYTAVGLNYGIFRRKDFNETAQYIMLYDMGASSTTATVISYQTAKTRDRGVVETNPQLSVLGVGYDRTLGGLEMQLRLQKHFAKKFNEMKKTQSDVFKNPRSMAKLFKEASRVKNVLSANADHFAQVEGLIDEIDFRVQVTREEFENMITDLIERVRKPLDDALKASHLNMDVISQVILVGAGTRVPAVQASLAAATGKELAKNLNTDEAAVMGAAYKAADLSKGFKVKKFITKDAVIFPIQVSFEREGESGNKKEVKRMLFGLMNPYPQKKIMTFNKHTADFHISVAYSDLDHLSTAEIERVGPLRLSEVELLGVDSALAKHTGEGSQYKGVKAHFQLDESGLLALSSAELVVERPAAADQESTLSRLGSTLSSLFSGNQDPQNATKDESSGEAEGDKVAEGEKKSNDSTTPGGKEGNDTAGSGGKGKEEPKPQTLVVREEIKLKQVSLVVPPMDQTDLTASVNKLADLNAFDEAKARRESAMNALESFVFDAQNKVGTEEYKKAATSAELESILAKCTELAAWLEDEGWESEVGPLEEKLGSLKKLTEPLWMRVREHSERPEALAALSATINGSAHFLAGIKNMTEHRPDSPDPMFTQVEVDTLEKAINEISEWKVKMIKEQSSMPLSESPKLTLRSIVEKMHQLDREVKYLVNKAKIWKPKAKETASGKSSTNQSDSGSKSTPSNQSEKIVETDASPDKPGEKDQDNEPSDNLFDDELKSSGNKETADSSETTSQEQGTSTQSEGEEPKVHTEL